MDLLNLNLIDVLRCIERGADTDEKLNQYIFMQRYKERTAESYILRALVTIGISKGYIRLVSHVTLTLRNDKVFYNGMELSNAGHRAIYIKPATIKKHKIKDVY